MDGRRYLEKLINDRLDLARRDPRAPFDRSEIRGIALGLVAASALSQKEMEAILAKLDRSLEALGRFTTVSQTLRVADRQPPNAGATALFAAESGPESAGDAVESLGGTAAPADPGEPKEPAPRLIRVVPLARDMVLWDAPATLVSVEVWTTVTRLHLAYPGSGPRHREILRRWRPWRAYDDTGGQYRGGGGGAYDSDGLLLETRIFEPGPAEWAQTLTVRAYDARGRKDEFSVPLR